MNSWIAPKFKSKRFFKTVLFGIFFLVNVQLWYRFWHSEDTQPIPVLKDALDQSEQFLFDPTPDLVPFKSKAVIALLTSDATSKQKDLYYLNTLSLVYSLTHHPDTKLHDDVEVAVIVSDSISKEERDSLKSLGVRLIIVQPIVFDGIKGANDEWKNCYTKLYMFKMTFYKQILYLDADLTISKKIDTLFDLMEMKKLYNPSEYFFGAVQDWGLSAGTFNAGLMIFEPSMHHYNNILENVKHTDKYDSKMMEQGLLNWYFQPDNHGPGQIGWNSLPVEYNIQWVNDRSMLEIQHAHIFHCKVWRETVPPQVYEVWRDNLRRVLQYQERDGKPDLDYVPRTHQQLQSYLKEGIFGQRKVKMNKGKPKIAIYTLLAGSDIEQRYEVDRIIANRERYVKKWNDIHYIQRKLDNVRFAVWQKVYDAEKLIKDYDWIWFLDADAYIMNPNISLYDLLTDYEEEHGSDVNLIIANDCNGFNAGSFFVHKSAWTAEFVKRWKAMEYRDDFANADIWKEQAALVHLYQTNEYDARKNVYVVPQKDINAYAGAYCGYGYQPGDFIVHSPGMGYNGVKDFLKANNYTEV